MKIFSVKTLVCGFGLLSSAAATAASPKNVLWQNERGFVVPADYCRTVELRESPYRVNTLGGNALVRVVEASGQTVRVARLSQGANATSQRAGTEADVAKAALKDLSEQVIQIKASPVERIRQTGNVKVQGTFWQAAMKGDMYLALRCATARTTTDYYLFDVFTDKNVDPVTTVGVPAKQTDIFLSSTVRTIDEAERQIQDQQRDQSAQTNTVRVSGAGSASSGSSASSTSNSSASKDSSSAPKQNRQATRSGVQGSVGANGSTPTEAPIVPPAIQTPASAPANDGASVEGGADFVVCTSSDILSVRSKDLKSVLFKAGKLEIVQPIQAFGAEKVQKTVGGKTYTFINVKFPARQGADNTGWVADSYIKLKSDCRETKPAAQRQEPQQQQPRDGTGITGLDDPNCCEFPVTKRPTTSYREGMRRFRAGRSGGRRLHAACDLYRAKGEATVAVADGKVLRGPYYFYQGTYAVEVRHTGGFIARYGEVLGKSAGVSAGKSVKMGQTVGFVGKVNSGCCEPMLHFELYEGTLPVSMGLNAGKNAFRRRADLLDPTKRLQKWEKAEFGESF